MGGIQGGLAPGLEQGSLQMTGPLCCSQSVAVTAVLLSGGIASACVATWRRPEVGLFVNYGQAAAPAGRVASRAVAERIGLHWVEVAIDCSALREPADQVVRARVGKLLGGDAPVEAWPDGWPYRNQLLITFGAAWAGPRSHGVLLLGAGSADGGVRPDGTHLLFRRADQLVRMQPGRLRVSLPALGLSLAELVLRSGATPELLRLTYSCEVATKPCGACSGCLGRAALARRSASAATTLPMRQR
jgi:7-cyano-7-deazaguanine synthase